MTSAAASGGVFTSTNTLTWATYPATETVTHISLWDNVSAGNCLWTGALAAPVAITSSQTFTIASGNLTVTVA